MGIYMINVLDEGIVGIRTWELEHSLCGCELKHQNPHQPPDIPSSVALGMEDGENREVIAELLAAIQRPGQDVVSCLCVW